VVAQSMSGSFGARRASRASRLRSVAWAEVDAGLRFLALLWVGVMAGFFVAFSVLVMPGLDRVDAAAGIAAMQAINAAVASVAVAFGGASLLCLAVIASAAVRRSGGWLAPLGALVYLVGVFGVTVAFNVQLNDELDLVAPSSPSAAAAMADYLVEWTRWNHVRTATGILSFALIGASLLRGRRGDGGRGGPTA